MSYPRPQRETAHLTCPGCWCNSLVEILPPGGGVLGQAAWLQCTVCPWVGSSADLRQPSSSAEIAACMREDQARGTPGSSSNGNTRKKPVQWVRGESRRAWDSGVTTNSQRICSTRTRVIRYGSWTLRVTDSEWVSVLALSGGNYPQGLRRLIVKRLGKDADNLPQLRQAIADLLLEFLSKPS